MQKDGQLKGNKRKQGVKLNRILYIGRRRVDGMRPMKVYSVITICKMLKLERGEGTVNIICVTYIHKTQSHV